MQPTPNTPANRNPYLWEQAKKRVEFKQHLRTYVLINAAVWTIYLALTFFVDRRIGRFPWPVFMTFGWGIGLVSHYLSVYWQGNGSDPIEREYQRLQQSQ
ncbi:hypothetical protein F5984_09495 [Rudanella paleaurantiibacter]|uniref:2TM domain-containing protein n=1 Tax=Rudanella paleaurantiibacter TaxID=2614655 RepID=A0A7J5TZX0_9BACT|nr:2TM domain-containing protein [Rudanella paleaurantiibacter]KAB7731043.1 hypothetical protein F5984_09495 [Rudanella paleaurantiibacter]